MNDFGPPPPVLDLSFEQEFQLARFAAQAAKENKELLAEIAIDQQRHIYVLRNTITNLLNHWNEPQQERAGEADEHSPVQESPEGD